MTGEQLPKFPPRPTGSLSWDRDDLVHDLPVLWRIHKTGGPHPTPWDHLRAVGPLPRRRWDPHGGDPDVTSEAAALYAAVDLTTAVAEVYQAFRRVDPTTHAPYSSSWTPTRPLTLLDLTGTWLVRMGAAHAVMASENAETTRNWTRAIHHAAAGALDGIMVQSTITGAPMPILFETSRDAMPPRPAWSRPRNNAAVRDLLDSGLPGINYQGTEPATEDS